MKHLLSLYGMMMICILGSGQQKVEASVSNFANSKGVCRSCLFNSAASFANSQPLRCEIVGISANKASFSFQDVPDGTYAIFVFHDQNNNGKFDTNFLGIPREGYGASGNKLPFAAAPKFDANKFTVKGHSISLAIRLRNL